MADIRCGVYVVMQAVGKEFKGFKPIIVDKEIGGTYNFLVFSTKESARDYLIALLKKIKHEQSNGIRTKDNLDPKTGLDFIIQKAELIIPSDMMSKKGWNI